MRASSNRIVAAVLAAAVILCGSLVAGAAERKSTASKPGAFNPDHETVQLFEAVDAGDLEVKFIPRSSKEARILVENKSDRPLNVQMPKAFAALPVLAQRQGGLGGGGGGLGGGGGGGQAMGGGGGGMMGGGGGGGMFNVPAERLAQVKVECVCLEHGKPEPRASMPYEIKPIDHFTSDARVHRLLEMIGTPGYSQSAAQAAAWHFTDEMSWTTLADKKIERIGGFKYPYFAEEDLARARELASNAQTLAARAKEKATASYTDDERYRADRKPRPAADLPRSNGLRRDDATRNNDDAVNNDEAGDEAGDE